MHLFGESILAGAFISDSCELVSDSLVDGSRTFGPNDSDAEGLGENFISFGAADDAQSPIDAALCSGFSLGLFSSGSETAGEGAISVQEDSFEVSFLLKDFQAFCHHFTTVHTGATTLFWTAIDDVVEDRVRAASL